MGKKRAPDTTKGADDQYAEIIVVEEEKPPRPDDSTAKCRALNAIFTQPKFGLETKLYYEMDRARFDEVARSLRNQLIALLREGGTEAANGFVTGFSPEIDKRFGEGKAERLLQILSENNG